MITRQGSAAGVFITLLLVIGLIGLGVYLMRAPTELTVTPNDPTSGEPTATPAAAGSVNAPEGDRPDPIEPATRSPRLEAAAPYVPKDNIVDVDISEYAGYAGLIVANGGLEPNPESVFAKQFGFQVRLSLSEGENWGALNNGKFAASATTVDVLAVLGRSFEVTVPVQIAFSRGADMLIVDRGITSVNQLAGKTLAAAQFNESEFFLRYLAGEAGLGVTVLRDLDGKPKPGTVGLVFYEDAFVACDAYHHELASDGRLAGAVGWSPRTDEVVAASGGAAKVLASNRNLLVIADILCVNKGFAASHPKLVEGLVHGLLEGNRRVRDDQESHLGLIARSLKWEVDETREELKKVHFSNLPENRAFFDGTIDAAGSFAGIYQSSVLAYGADLIPNPPDASRFIDQAALTSIAAAGAFAQQVVAIAPIRSRAGSPIEGDALLSKDIRFLYEPNSATLDATSTENTAYLETIRRYLQVSPGSVILLRGHVDDAMKDGFRQQGGEALVRNMALKAMELSKQRADSVRTALLAKFPGIAADRIEVIGRGWEEPSGTDSAQNRRVEVRWFTIE